MKTLDIALKDIFPYENNPRNNDNAVDAVANSIREFGFQQPLVLDKNNVIIVGHTRYKAAKKLGLKSVPCVIAENLTDEQCKAYRLADNKVGELAEWNMDLLAIELDEIDFDMGEFGFDEIDDIEEPVKDLIRSFDYKAKSVIDDMPKNCTMEEIERTFYAVGFGSVPSWLKPYHVLSNGEKMRVDLARAILENDFFVFDEFTSVVDRQVAQTACIAIEKSIRKNNKQFVAVSCHDDILEWLQPDWVLDTNTMKSFFTTAHDLKKVLKSENVGEKNGTSLASIII